MTHEFDPETNSLFNVIKATASLAEQLGVSPETVISALQTASPDTLRNLNSLVTDGDTIRTPVEDVVKNL
jgi:hypothetical protein